jgi:hypothetical protein
MQQQQQPPPTMNELSLRFGVLQRKFVEFSERVHELLRRWLVYQKESVVEVSVNCLSEYLFNLQGVPVNHSDAPLNWVKTIAHFALKDQLSCLPLLQIVKAGSSVIFLNIPGLLAIEWPIYSRTSLVIQTSDEVDELRRKNSVLEVRVLELETRLSSVFPRSLRSVRSTSLPSSSSASFSAEDTRNFLLEKRLEAEDSIHLLRRVQGEFSGRKRVLDMMLEDQERRHVETRRSDAKKSRAGLVLATQEIVRLRAELELTNVVLQQHQQTTAASVVSAHSAVDLNAPIVPRRALVIAGFWDVSHNDVLFITPHLVARFERMDGKIVKRKDSQVCFQVKDPQVLIDVVVEIMANHLPQYQRTPSMAGPASRI